APPSPLTEDEIDEVLQDLVCWYDNPDLARDCLPPGEEFLAQIERVALSDEPRFIAPLVDMLWLELGWERWVREALERVSGERFASASDWYAWMTASPPPLPDGYAEWKGRLLSVIDPSFVEIIPEAAAINGPGPEQLVWALVRGDAVPPLVEPENVHRVEELYLQDSNIVFGVVVDGVQRAYPERIIGWHGSVTDVVNGTPLIIWHCPSCGGATAFNRTASNGANYTFSASGFVWESRRLFRDAETSSLWDAVSGRAVAGPLAEAGVHLTPRVSVRTTWGEWAARYPNTRVLSLETGFVRNYDEAAYLTDDLEQGRPPFPVPRFDDRLAPMELVFAVSIGGSRKAYPLAAVESAGVVRDTVGGVDIVILSPGSGRGVTAYETLGTFFGGLSGPADDRVVMDGDEIAWFVDDERLLNTRNSRVRTSVPAQVARWFAWSGAYPETDVWEP
ncbi:MAG: DUF3179 domain-containing (seleno)protein, partial [Dehalococcoidia bacterium]